MRLKSRQENTQNKARKDSKAGKSTLIGRQKMTQRKAGKIALKGRHEKTQGQAGKDSKAGNERFKGRR